MIPRTMCAVSMTFIFFSPPGFAADDGEDKKRPFSFPPLAYNASAQQQRLIELPVEKPEVSWLRPSYIAYAGVAGDVLSTEAVLKVQKHAIEGNPILGHHPSDALVLGTGFVRAAMIWASDRSDAHGHPLRMSLISGISWGVTANNIAVLSGQRSSKLPMAFGISVAIPVGVGEYRYGKKWDER